jgi:hypothetical protein
MKLRELIELLEDQTFDGDDVEVRLAIQPNYPFQHTIADVVLVQDRCRIERDEDSWWCETHEENGDDDESLTDHRREVADRPGIVYIADGDQLYDEPYLPGAARDALGW